MRTHRIAFAAAPFLAALFTGCILIPQIKDRVVDLATSGQAVAGFHATGSTNVYSETETYDLRSEVDIRDLVDKAGIDVSDVKSITLGGVSYRVTVPDANAARKITNGAVTIACQGNPDAAFIDNFTVNAGAATDWMTPTLNSAGVAQVNALLASILTELHGGALANESVKFTVNGTSSPAGNTDFKYEIRLTLSIVGSIKTKVID